MNKNVHISFDLDGTCCQFDERIIELTSYHPRVLDQQGLLWPTIVNTPNFFKHLAPYPEMVELVHEVKALGVPIRVITGRPKLDTYPTATQDKLDWCATHFGTDVDVIVCLARDKQKYMKPYVTDILVDDFVKNIDRWRLSGGVAIHHTNHEATRMELFKLLNI